MRCLHFIVLLAALVIALPKLSSNKPLDSSELGLDDDLSGKCIVITGGTAGVGLEAAKILASRGAKVIITGRSKKRADAVAATIPGDGKVAGMELDLSSEKSVSMFAEKLLKQLEESNSKLDSIILNAGMVYGDDFDGPYSAKWSGGVVDMMISSNHLGHFMLINSLKGKLEASDSRVVFVSSISHWLGTEASLLPENLVNPLGATDGDIYSSGLGRLLNMMKTYGTTKLMNVLMANKLSNMWNKNDKTLASVVVCTPGFAATNIGLKDRQTDRFNPLDYLPLTRTAEEGGEVLVAAVTISSKR